MKLISIKPLVIHFKEIDSTQNYLKKHYKSLPNLTFIFSDYQSVGRGRRGREWVSNKGDNLLFSILIKDKNLVSKFDSLSIISALLVKELLSRYGIKNIEIKWPNDVYIDSKKAAGILLEGVNKNNKLDAVIIGIGINVNQTDFVDGLRINPTSIKLILNKDIDMSFLRKKIYKDFSKRLSKIDGINYLKEINKINFLKNKVVSFEYKDDILTGVAKDINEDNSLSILVNNEIIKVKSGEVNHVKVDGE